MDIGAPLPAIALRGSSLVVAYYTREAPTDSAVVRFDGVLQHTFGYPNDEALPGHPMYCDDLEEYAFNEVLHSAYVAELVHRNQVTFPDSSGHIGQFRHWIVPFHDETLEVVGKAVTVVGIVASASPIEAAARRAG